MPFMDSGQLYDFTDRRDLNDGSMNRLCADCGERFGDHYPNRSDSSLPSDCPRDRPENCGGPTCDDPLEND